MQEIRRSDRRFDHRSNVGLSIYSRKKLALENAASVSRKKNLHIANIVHATVSSMIV